MSTEIARRGGSTAEHSTFTGAAREITIDTTKWTAVVHDNSTPGGFPLQKEIELTGPAILGRVSGTGAPIGLTPAQAGSAIDVSPLGGFRNKIINGDFGIWQRDTSQTNSGYGSDDRWVNANTGTTKTHSRQAFTLGQTDVPGNPRYYSRTVVTTSAGASNLAVKRQAIEGVAQFSGQNVTVTFWAKADASKNIALELFQDFGTGGSPSSAVTGIGAQLVALTTSWQKKSVVISVPSVAGKTLGTDMNDTLNLAFWFDAGSSWNARTASLGQQSGTFEIAHVSLVIGDATQEADPFSPRHPAQEEFLCKRYYEAIRIPSNGYVAVGQAYSTSAMVWVLNYQAKRAEPTIVVPTTIRPVTSTASATTVSSNAPSSTGLVSSRIISTVTGTPLVAGNASGVQATGTDATITVSAEL